ncbi:hypothetical protein EDE04_1055 [Streptomyces sp. 2132.2]|uniref:hypothetical protein n=1 Tax=Streptomyces sp. 2132.2 TaxID=2485161 RepID=UPI000FAD4D06|nr:hypothetical protein [Streptomyces sp. 2132.2]ROQ94625.1 hypothetical protein EDE04_1055 [Streptomyces sp. 2132.2]
MSAREIPTLKSQYAEKVAADLDLNTGEQERIRQEIASLQERLAGLEQDHALLVGMRAALGDVVTPVPAPRAGRKTATATAVTTAPAKRTPATKETAKKATVKKAPAKRTAAGGKATAAKKAAPKEPAKAAVKEPAKESAKAKAVASKEKQVPLTELIHRHLSGQAEPRTAREIAQALKAADPARSVSDNLVRTTTERLVARSLAERVKQGATVYYTALPRHGEAGEAPAAADGTAAGTATEKETENTPVPAGA